MLFPFHLWIQLSRYDDIRCVKKGTKKRVSIDGDTPRAFYHSIAFFHSTNYSYDKRTVCLHKTGVCLMV